MQSLELREQDKQGIKSKGMKLFKRIAKYSWQNYKTNENS
jgi:hypothetical protein